jgi:hypothetical protein
VAAPNEDPDQCPACGGRLSVFVRLRRSESRTPLAYFKCERCAHVVIVEE